MNLIIINNIAIEVTKKDIKHIHLSVMPPNGKVKISAPLTVTDDALNAFASSKLSWIKEQLKKLDKQERESRREYITGESFFFLGRKYRISVIVDQSRNLEIKCDKVILTVKATDTLEQKEVFVKEWYRRELKSLLTEIIEKWSNKTNLHPSSWLIKDMKTKWGSCNLKTKNLLFTLQLAKKPVECIEYVVLHELCHLKIEKHNQEFTELLDSYMPNWRERKGNLNSFILDYINAGETNAN